MHPVQRAPSFLRRHSLIRLLVKFGLLKNPALAYFNEGSKAFVNLLDPEPRNVFLKRQFEPDFFEISKAFLKKGSIFFDLGANHGFCSFGLVPDRPQSAFHLFEANSALGEIIKKSIAIHQDVSVKLSCSCVTDKPGSSSFFLERTQTGQSHVASGSETGDMITNLVLDQYCNDQNVKEVDFAKIDLEGHELSAFKGWKNFLSSHKTKAIYVEIMPENQVRYGLPTNSPLIFLEQLGYELFLCKKEDFGRFGNLPFLKNTGISDIALSFFKAEDYPEDFSTDVLALAPN
jgi:FkbM family methyltransferase